MTRRTQAPPEDYVPSETAARIVQAVTITFEPMLLRLFPDRVHALMTQAAWAVDKILTRTTGEHDATA